MLYYPKLRFSDEKTGNLQNGGLIYFVVKIDNNRDYRIFYRTLLPLDIQKYLQRAQGNSISIHLKPLDKQKPQQITALCNYFLKHKPLQVGKKTISIDDIDIKDDLSNSVFTLNPGEIITSFLDGDYYTYKQVNGDTLPVIFPQIDDIRSIIMRPVSVNGSVFFDRYGYKTIEDTIILYFGKNVEINTTTRRIAVSHRGDYRDVLKATEFVSAFMEYGQFELNRKDFSLGLDGSNKEKRFVQENTKVYKQLNDLKFVLYHLA